ncbi:CsbD family protein [Sphingobacterium lactis]|uniref:CsbD family protein n=1 Tax=Sphingobacterium lactis TaxID=797291 RepID=UPI003F815A62
MESLDFKGRWDIIKGRIKEEHPDLTDEDLTYEEGKEEDVYGRFQQRFGKSREEIQDWFNKLDKR